MFLLEFDLGIAMDTPLSTPQGVFACDAVSYEPGQSVYLNGRLMGIFLDRLTDKRPSGADSGEQLLRLIRGKRLGTVHGEGFSGFGRVVQALVRSLGEPV